MAEENTLDESKYQVELPINGSQHSEYLKMGIEFGPFNSGDDFRGANLPPGWRLGTKEKCKQLFIIDSKNRARANVYVKEHIHMTAINRFKIGRDITVEGSNVRFCIWDHAVEVTEAPRVIYEKAHAVPNISVHKSAHEERVNFHNESFVKEAELWLKDKFPNWEDASLHWD